METTVSYRRRGAEGTLTLRGVVDIFEAGTLREAALRALNDGKAASLQVDFSGVERLDVSAIQVLCALRQDMEAQERPVVSSALPAGVETFQAKIGYIL